MDRANNLIKDELAYANTPPYSVSELSAQIKQTLETNYNFVRLRGEISGYKGPHATGHCYFTLKDEKAVISAIIWRTAFASLRFKPQEGLEVIVCGRVTSFPGRSSYQIIIEELRPAGQGALRQLLEQRRQQLEQQGLFAKELKLPLPFMPQIIGVITSPSGAVIRDICQRIRDRFPLTILLWPVQVQGEKAAAQIIAAIKGFNNFTANGRWARPDLLIIARGGGSLEDLWPFNDEDLVYAVRDSKIPIISAIGHESDVTLLDYAADKRAATPSAAAEMAVPVKQDLLNFLRRLDLTKQRSFERFYQNKARQLNQLLAAMPSMARLINYKEAAFKLQLERLDFAYHRLFSDKDLALRELAKDLSFDVLDNYIFQLNARLTALTDRLAFGYKSFFHNIELAWQGQLARLALLNPEGKLARAQSWLNNLSWHLKKATTQKLQLCADKIAFNQRLLETLSYQAVLARGFALAFAANGELIRSKEQALRNKVIRLSFKDGDILLRPLSHDIKQDQAAAREK